MMLLYGTRVQLVQDLVQYAAFALTVLMTIGTGNRESPSDIQNETGGCTKKCVQV